MIEKQLPQEIDTGNEAPVNKPLIYDLHTHTIASDGYLTPSELIQRAVEKEVSVLAITDHDTTAGLQEAHQYINEQNLSLQLINGVEISTAWQGFDIHIVGLNIDPMNPVLVERLADQKQRRQQRALNIAEKLEKVRIPQPLAGTMAIAAGAELTRAHFARYLLEIGQVNSLEKAFTKYLAKGRSAYVAPCWCTIEEAVQAIHAAGGKAILAHPTRYDLSAKWLRRLIVDFKEMNGDGLEVSLSQQSIAQRQQMARYTVEYELLASAGSDFHRACMWLDIGRNIWLPEDVKPVWLYW